VSRLDVVRHNVVLYNAWFHGRNLVGDTGTCPSTFSDGGDIICHVPTIFSL